MILKWIGVLDQSGLGRAFCSDFVSWTVSIAHSQAYEEILLQGSQRLVFIDFVGVFQ